MRVNMGGGEWRVAGGEWRVVSKQDPNKLFEKTLEPNNKQTYRSAQRIH
jgi:hypothetical protein